MVTGHRKLDNLPRMTAEEFMEVVHAATETNQGGDMIIPSKDVLLGPQKTIVLPWQGAHIRLEPTKHAYSQLYTRLGQGLKGYNRGLPHDYLDAISDNLWEASLREALDGMPPTSYPWQFRTNDKGELRAAFTKRYIPWDGRDSVKLAMKVAAQIESATGGTVSVRNARSDANYTGASYVWGGNFLELEESKGYEVGFHISTEETGRAQLEIEACLYRTSCENSYRLLGYGFKAKKFLRPQSIESLFWDVFAGIKSAATQTVLAITNAEEIQIPDIAEVMKGFCVTNGITEALFYKALEGREQRDNLAGLVHGITHASKFAEDPLTSNMMQEQAVNALFGIQKNGLNVKIAGSDGKSVAAQYQYVPVENMTARIQRWRNAATKDLVTVEPQFAAEE